MAGQNDLALLNEPIDPAKKLASAARVQRVPSRELELFIIADFIGPNECQDLIDLIDRNRRPSTIADDSGIANYRTSETCDLDPDIPVVGKVDDRISALLGIPATYGEPLQGQRYAPGQEFKPHTDTFNPDGYDFYVHTAERGQRTWTVMIYLNVPEDGGATRFKRIGKSIQPEIGKLLAWNNLLPNGNPNYETLHQGMKVRRGTKYILTKWFRQRPATGSDLSI